MRRSETGATLVEFAILLPVFILLVFGIVDWSRYMIGQNSVNSVARESARYGSAVGDNGSGTPLYVDCDGIRDAGYAAAHTIGIRRSDIVVEYDDGTGGSIGSCPDGGTFDAALISEGDRVIVTVSAPFPFVTPLIGDFFGPTTLTSSDKRTIFK